MSKELLIVFAKVPLPGSCKTRLAASIGDERAARLAEAFLRETIELGEGAGCDRALYFAPAEESERARRLAPPGWTVEPQSGGDLGLRMAGAFEEAFRRGYERAAVIGSDSPQLGAPLVRRAFELLGVADVVLGPATDGGYYLMALRSPCPGLFAGIPWSTPAVLSRTLARCGSLGLTVELLPELRDVDELGDLLALVRYLADSGGSPALLQACLEALVRGG
ncbi:MAG: TIGR04282 family arsenosugar biosynthesis glycosyltransferase [Candidatus Wallbacteria bacterium]|nr:TIGR04282 family arsenosugar biosynthesis glycosyltransferase [Candidatus Wallbacteria bacterium]